MRANAPLPESESQAGADRFLSALAEVLLDLAGREPVAEAPPTILVRGRRSAGRDDRRQAGGGRRGGRRRD